MMKPLLVLAFLSLAAAGPAADAPRAAGKPLKKSAKPAVAAPAAKPGARAVRRKSAVGAVVPAAAAPSPPPVACRWLSPDPVAGSCGGPGCASPPCSTANRGAQGMGGGGLWTCTCQ